MLAHRVYTLITAAYVAAADLPGPVPAGSPGSSAVEVLEVRRHSLPWNDHNILRDIRKSRLVTAVLGRASPDIYKTNASLDLSWTDAELFS